MFVVAGVTGNTGSVVADALLSAGEKVRVLVRDERKGEAWRARGAEVAVGALDDAAFLEGALKGARGAYLLLPPTPSSPDALASQRALVDVLLRAVPASGVKHVVMLSSVAAQHPEGTGPIRSAYDSEQRLGALATPFTFVRAAFFLENFAPSVGAVKGDGVLPSFTNPDTRLAMVSTRDIGETAAEALRAGPAKAGRIIELAGPRDHTPAEVAAAFGRKLGRPVRAVAIPNEAAAATLQQFGVGASTASLLAELYRGVDRGLIDYEGTPRRGRITIDEFAATLLG
jgi:uncharacterized protein YbjT (DUF2867 family)